MLYILRGGIVPLIQAVLLQTKLIQEVKESKAKTGRKLHVAGDGKFDSPG